ncbi:MAG: hypothetical protein AAF800_04660 [Planctomycetota bacterium]
MRRRAGKTPPYEIMRDVGGGSPLPRSAVSRLRGGSTGWLGTARGVLRDAAMGAWGRLSGLVSWRPGSGAAGAVTRPVGLHLPVGVWGLLAVTVLAAMGLMFQIGTHVAGRGGDERVAVETLADSGEDTSTAAPDAGGDVVAMGSREAWPPSDLMIPGGSTIVTVDPRELGRNYFVLTTVRPDEVEFVRELQVFLAEGGLATYLDSANNGRFRRLIDVTRGYTREERSRGLHDAHEQRIRELGRAWQRKHGGLGTDLRDLYPERFDGPPPGN